MGNIFGHRVIIEEDRCATLEDLYEILRLAITLRQKVGDAQLKTYGADDGNRTHAVSLEG